MLRGYLADVKPQMLAEQQARDLLEFINANPDFAGDPAQTTPLLPLADYVKMLLLLYEELYQDLEITELQYEAAQLQVHLVKMYVKTQKQRIANELQNSNDARTKDLLETVKKLDNLLRAHKGGA